MPDKRAIYNFTRKARAVTAAAGHWWLSELAAMIPAPIRRTILRPADMAVIHIKGSEAVVRHSRAGNVTEIRREPLARLSQVVVSPVPSRRPALVLLDPEISYIDRFKVPAAAQARLRQAVSFEVERRSPFRSKDAPFDFSITGRNDNEKTFDIEWATIPADLVGIAQNNAHKLGYFPVAVGLPDTTQANLKYTFARQKLSRSFHPDRAMTVLLAALALFLGALIYAGHGYLAQAAAAADQIAALKPAAEKAQKTKTSAEAMLKALAVIAARTNEPKVLDVLEGVTTALPDDSWVSEFAINGDQLRLAGYSAAASSLPERLAAIPLFDHPQFRAAITPEAGDKGGATIDRFDIGLTISGRRKAGEAQ